MGKQAAMPRAFATALLLAALCGCKQGRPEPKPVIGTSFMMSTVVEYKFYGENAQRAKDAVERTLGGLEERMSLYLPGSEIDRLNQDAGGRPTAVSEDTFELLSRCVEYGALSDGVFDVTIAPLAEEWGIASEHPKVPPRERIEELLPLVDYRGIELDAAGGTARLRKAGQAVDVGGIAKGFACDLAREAAKREGVASGYLSIGGNLMVIGQKPDGEDFRFGVRDPRGGPNDFIAVVTLPDSTMATSGDYERFFERDGVRYHHILDPSTGRPAESDLMSVSAVAPDGAYADFLSTWLFIKGKEFALSHLDDLGAGLIVVGKDRDVFVSESLKGSFEPSDETGDYRFHGVRT